MNQREQILANVRLQQLAAVDLPTLDGRWIEFADPVGEFCEMLAAIGGQVIPVPSRAAIVPALTEQLSTPKRWSAVPDVVNSTVEVAHGEFPGALAEIDLAIVTAKVGIAENGAVWVAAHQQSHRAVLFLCEHLVVLLGASTIVPTMHSAYARLLASGGGPGVDPFGVFIAGPSKTADIEQSLVIGAQGPRVHTVVVIADE